MAYKITKILDEASLHDKVLAVLGYGHCQFGAGVPERVFKKMPTIEDYTSIIITNEWQYETCLESGADFDI